MVIIRTVAALEEYIGHAKANGNSIGFVPTMGALHEGHLSLMERAVKDNELAVASVFVNPTQFNNPHDLATYPRDEENDFRLLAEAGVAAVFAPTVDEMYPGGEENFRKEFALGTAAEVMEGKQRPGHFQGVAQVVSRLFALVRPDRAYFGEKDFQQIAVIRNMVESEGINVDIIPCPIKRAPDGLALSSRNTRLSAEERALAPEIHRALEDSREYGKTHSLDATRRSVIERLDAVPGMKVEYFEIVDSRTLLPLEEWEESPSPVGCITVWLGDVRLIDNVMY